MTDSDSSLELISYDNFLELVPWWLNGRKELPEQILLVDPCQPTERRDDLRLRYDGCCSGESCRVKIQVPENEVYTVDGLQVIELSDVVYTVDHWDYGSRCGSTEWVDEPEDQQKFILESICPYDPILCNLSNKLVPYVRHDCDDGTISKYDKMEYHKDALLSIFSGDLLII